MSKQPHNRHPLIDRNKINMDRINQSCIEMAAISTAALYALEHGDLATFEAMLDAPLEMLPDDLRAMGVPEHKLAEIERESDEQTRLRKPLATCAPASSGARITRISSPADRRSQHTPPTPKHISLKVATRNIPLMRAAQQTHTAGGLPTSMMGPATSLHPAREGGGGSS